MPSERYFVVELRARFAGSAVTRSRELSYKKLQRHVYENCGMWVYGCVWISGIHPPVTSFPTCTVFGVRDSEGSSGGIRACNEVGHWRGRQFCAMRLGQTS